MKDSDEEILDLGGDWVWSCERKRRNRWDELAKRIHNMKAELRLARELLKRMSDIIATQKRAKKRAKK